MVRRERGVLETEFRDRLARIEMYQRTALHGYLCDDRALAVDEALHSEEVLIRELERAMDLLRADVLFEGELADVHAAASIAERTDHGRLEPWNERHHEILQQLDVGDFLLGSDDEVHQLVPGSVQGEVVVDIAVSHYVDGRVFLKSFANPEEFTHFISLQSFARAFGYTWV